MGNDKLKNEGLRNEHVEQFVVGNIVFGNAGIDKKRKEKGYVRHLCTVDENNRFVDLALTESQIYILKDRINAEIKDIEREKERKKE